MLKALAVSQKNEQTCLEVIQTDTWMSPKTVSGYGHDIEHLVARFHQIGALLVDGAGLTMEVMWSHGNPGLVNWALDGHDYVKRWPIIGGTSHF